VEQIIRPTGLVDPEILIQPIGKQVDDLIGRIKKRVEKNERTLVITLTKRMAEDLAGYLADLNFKVRYMHSDIDTLERIEIIRGLRLGEFDVLVGINLLREGLDLPEVTLVAILDADKEGFLRAERSLIQIIGRAARNVNGQVVLYADKITQSIEKAVEETNRRRQIQIEFNKKHKITPKSIVKPVKDIVSERKKTPEIKIPVISKGQFIPPEDLPEVINKLRKAMEAAADRLDFESAAAIRDKIYALEKEES
jgi:excinuclease ABC subunit B